MAARVTIWLRELIWRRGPGQALAWLSAAAADSHHRLTVPVLLLALGFSALCGSVLWQARRATEARAVEVATSVVNSLSTDIERNIELLNLSLEAVVDGVHLPELASLEPTMRRRVLFDNSLMARGLTSILVTDETGRVMMDSRRTNPPRLNISDRDFFQIHRDHPLLGSFISRPFVSRTNNQQMIAVSRRITREDGSFGGIVVGALLQDYFKELFKSIALGPQGTVTLARIDGTVLTRWPHKGNFNGSDLSHAALFNHFPRAPSGHYQSTAISDGIQRLFVYSQVGALPLVIVIGQSVEDVFAPWWKQALATGALVGVLCAMTIALTALLRRELIRRTLAEKKLTVLAATDGLTGLANRRHFNRTLASEWRRAMRKPAPAALLMIDLDNFKQYNDRYGHPAGDALLRDVAAAIAKQAKRPSDLGARLGGDEFALLLPDTTLSDAADLAGRLRADWLFEGERRDSGVGLSIGIACLVPGPGAIPRHLIVAADRALYRAKRLGRNRIELAAIEAGNLVPCEAEMVPSK